MKTMRLKLLLAEPLKRGQHGSGFSAGKVRFIKQSDINDYGGLKNNIPSYINEYAPRHVLKDGDILFVGSGSVGKTYYHQGSEEILTYVYFLIRARVNPNLLVPKYLYYCTLTKDYEYWVNSNYLKTTVPNIYPDQIENLKIPYYSLEVQQQIVKYLDWKVSVIDNLLSKCQKEITYFASLKQSCIDEFVDSIKDYPLRPLKTYLSFGCGLNITKAYLGEEGIRCVNYGEIHKFARFSISSDNPLLKGLSYPEFVKISKYARLEKGDFVFADTSEDLAGSGNFTYFAEGSQELYAGYHTVVGKPTMAFNSKFLAYYLESNQWRSQIRKAVNGVKVYSITKAILRSSKVQMPDLDIQNSLVRKADQVVPRLEKLIQINKEKIVELKKLRKSLVTEVVSGQFDVSNIIVPEHTPFLPEELKDNSDNSEDYSKEEAIN